jgi:hypothetical protein
MKYHSVISLPLFGVSFVNEYKENWVRLQSSGNEKVKMGNPKNVKINEIR